jgi:hypothetical protein
MAINEEADRFSDWAELVQVAISSGQRYPALMPHVLYDGQPNWLTDWLAERDVPVWSVRSTFYEQLQSISRQRGQPAVTQIGAGALLRVELPRITRERDVHDRYVLYTDVDVLVLADPTDTLSRLEPRYFAAAPEMNPTDLAPMNSGVMVMNLPALRREQRRFFRHLTRNLNRYSEANRAWDQDAYQEWYGLYRNRINHKVSWRLERLLGFPVARSVLWDSLPPTLNWKPHWGANPDAQIIHFHGPKPTHRPMFDSPDWPALLRPIDMDYFSALCEIWDEELRFLKSGGDRRLEASR